MKPRQHGFTLVELIVVIVILGILAATALPRFINVTGQAQRAAVEGVAGGLRSGITVVQAAWQAQGATGSNVNVSGGTVAVITQGVPENALTGIGAAMGCGASPCQGNAVVFAGGVSGTSTWTPGNNPANCHAVYNAGAGTVSTVTAGCAP